MIAILGWLINYYFNYSIERSELTEISGFLQSQPKFEKGKSWHMEIDLDSDHFRYQTDGLSYAALDKEGVKSEVRTGSLVKILVSKNVGLEELLNSFVGIKRIYELKANNKTYLELKDYNKGKKDTRYLPLFIWLIFAAMYTYNFWIKNNRSITAPQAPAQDLTS